jgi:hypothetical protein
MEESCPVTVKPDYVLVPVVGTEYNGQGTFYKRRAKNAAPPAGGSVGRQPY